MTINQVKKWGASLMLVLFGVGLSGVADTTKDAAPGAIRTRHEYGAFSFTSIEYPVRHYFPDLSDTEYASLRPKILFFPYLPGMWAKAPLPVKGVFGLPGARYTSDDSVTIQGRLLRQTKNPMVRANTICQLGDAANRTACPILVRLLEKEPDKAVQTDILAALTLLKGTIPAAEQHHFLTEGTTEQRFQALALAAVQPETTVATCLEMLRTEKDATVRLGAWKALAARSPTPVLRYADWLPFWENPDADVGASLFFPGTFTEMDAVAPRLIKLCKTGAVAVRRSIVLHLPAEGNRGKAQQVLSILATDPNSSVRAAVPPSLARLRMKSQIPILLKLSADPEAEVRRSAALAMRAFPERDVFRRLVTLTGDPESPLVQEAAYHSLLAITDTFPVEREIAPAIKAKNQDIRLHVFRLLTVLHSKLHNKRLYTQLSREKRASNVAAAIQALSAGIYVPAIKKILPLGKSKAPEVRAAVAEFIGATKAGSGRELLSHYIQNDPQPTVRKAALIAMGRMADPWFNDALLAVLMRTDYRQLNPVEILGDTDRGYAAWSLAQMPSLRLDIAERLRNIVQRPVVMTMMGTIFDTEYARTCACWSLVQQARRSPKNAPILDFANSTIATLASKPDPHDSKMPPSSVGLRHYAEQIQHFLAGEPLERLPVPVFFIKFNFRRLKKPHTATP